MHMYWSPLSLKKGKCLVQYTLASIVAALSQCTMKITGTGCVKKQNKQMMALTSALWQLPEVKNPI